MSTSGFDSRHRGFDEHRAPHAEECAKTTNLIISVVGALLISVALPAWAVTPPRMAPSAEQADHIVVDKSERRMDLMRGDALLHRYRIRLGDAPVGHKASQGDERTPEGDYRISARNPASHYHLSLRISYPDASDRKQAQRLGADPGGDIFIHGGSVAASSRDWTDGCIAVTDSEIEQIWRLVPTGTPIHIAP